jgi:hypothetical protein
VNDDRFPACLRGPWGKFRGYGARLALILQLLRLSAREAAEEDVDGESVRRADHLVAYFQSHARKVYAAIGADPKVAEARRVLRWLAHSVNSVKSVNGCRRVSKRDLHTNVWGGSRTVEEVDSVVSLLCRHGYFRPVVQQDQGGPGRKPSPVYEVHPDAFQAQSS